MVREAERPALLQHMHRKEFWILTNKSISLVFVFKIYWSNVKILFYACVVEGCSASLTIAREKQT